MITIMKAAANMITTAAVIVTDHEWKEGANCALFYLEKKMDFQMKKEKEISYSFYNKFCIFWVVYFAQFIKMENYVKIKID